MLIIADEAPQSQTESRPEVEQHMTRSHTRLVAQPKQENNGGDDTVTLVGGDLRRVKRERNAGEDVETRSCKRPRKGQEVITLD